MKEQGHGHIPDDCWELIFEKVRQDDERDLDSISLVSKRFLSISNRVKHSLKVNDETLSFLSKFFQRFRHIETIVVDTYACKDIDGLVDLITLSGLLNLQAIKFSWCSTIHRRYGFKALVALDKKMKNNLKVLDCSGLVCTQDNDLVLIADLFPRLEELKIRAETNVTARITGEGVDALASKLKDLKEFVFTGMSVDTGRANTRILALTDTGISDLAEHLSNLIFIDVQGVLSCLVSPFTPSRKVALHLKYLRWRWTVPGPKKKEVDTFSPDFLPKNYRMRHLDVTGVRWLTDMTLMNFGQVCPNLQFLGVSHCMPLTNFGIGEVLRICPAITQLSIDSVKVSDVFGRYFVNHSIVNLKTLRARSTQINDKGMAMLGNRCQNLQYLDIGCCNKVTDKGVMEVVRNCARLRDILLGGCERVSTNILLQMVLSRPALRNIEPPCFNLVISVNR
ncbi:hypothetical protein RHMOL_Rhmol01G0026300 [Rhododendron molle]|uniref:Uncharacterized protein n=1 Tax=Rhododendron molle TaxID=49168 RepID=A0ACC0PZ88_RHOML|nr:hypothetical protein RHMOL_Rhmol01G0026300 [Rhododendron molle]